MTGHGLGRTDGQLLCVIAKGSLKRDRFSLVALTRRCSVSIQVLHTGGWNAGIAKRIAHDAISAVAVVRRSRNVVRVGAHAITDDFRDNRRAPILRMLQLFQDQNSGAFADYEPVALPIPGTRCLIRLVIARRQSTHGGEPADSHWSHASFAAAADHHIGVTVLYKPK